MVPSENNFLHLIVSLILHIHPVYTMYNLMQTMDGSVTFLIVNVSGKNIRMNKNSKIETLSTYCFYFLTKAETNIVCRLAKFFQIIRMILDKRKNHDSDIYDTNSYENFTIKLGSI